MYWEMLEHRKIALYIEKRWKKHRMSLVQHVSNLLAKRLCTPKVKGFGYEFDSPIINGNGQPPSCRKSSDSRLLLNTGISHYHG